MANKYPKEIEGNVLMWLGGSMSQAIYTGFRKESGTWYYTAGHKVQGQGVKGWAYLPASPVHGSVAEIEWIMLNEE
jgi:hypothetical protein